MILYNDKVIKGWSICPNTGKVYNDVTGEIRHTSICSSGYEYCCINRVMFTIHRALACTYYGVHDSSWDVHHKDGNKLNNILANLEWKDEHTHASETASNQSEEIKDKIREIMKRRIKGSTWFNNGIKCIRAFEKPDETWIEGRLKKNK